MIDAKNRWKCPTKVSGRISQLLNLGLWRDLVLLLGESEGINMQENIPESDEAIGLRVQMTQYQNEIKSLGSVVKKKSTQFPSLHTNSNIWAFLTQTTKEIESLAFYK